MKPRLFTSVSSHMAKKSAYQDYTFQYTRSVQPSINQHRHVINLLANELKQSQQIRKRPLPNKILETVLNPQPQIDHQLLSRLDQGYSMGDSLADAWIEFATSQNLPAYGMPLFNQILESGDLSLLNDDNRQTPQTLKVLFQQAMSKPNWLDESKIRIACRALSRYPFQQGLVLQSISLMGGYCVPALAEPLLATGQLTDNVVGRIARTLCFLGSVTIPKGLDYNEERSQWEVGFKQTLKTRVVHSLVRHKLKHDGYNDHNGNESTWNQQKYGVPINQTDMIATIMSFSITVIHGLKGFKCKLSIEEKNAILHLWRYVAHIIGVDDGLMPKTELECNQWLYAYLTTQAFNPTPASKLALALHELPVLLETNKFKGMAITEQNLRASVTRGYWGDDICDELGLPKPKLGKTGVFGLSNLQSVMEQLQKSSTFTQQMMMKSAKHYRTSIQAKYLASNPQLEPLFDEIYELAMRVDWSK